MTTTGPLLDYESAAAYLSVSERMVRHLWTRRELAAIKVGHLVRFAQDDLDRYIREHRTAAVA